MAADLCQFCNKPGSPWAGPTHQRSMTRYYRCDTCGHVWNADRDVRPNPPAGAVQDFTPPPPPRDVTRR